jgi:alpha-1,3-mannosyltransferase
MRILQVARQFYPKIGGIESSVLNLSRGLTARGHHVEVVTLNRDLRSGRSLNSPAEVDGIRIHPIPYIGSARYPIAPSWFRQIDSFDVIHIHAIDFFIDSAALGKRLRLHDKPIVVTTHGGIFHTPAWIGIKHFYWRNILKRTLAAAAAVIAVSEHDASLFSSIVPPEKLQTIYNGIDPIFAQARADRVRGRLVCVGRLSASKAIDRIVELLARLSAEFADVELVIAGPDEADTANALRRQVAALGLGSKVRIVGSLSITELSELVAGAHLFLSAAPHEGFGITTVEALAAGVPVMVTPTGIHQQIVRPGENGWFWSGALDAEAAKTLRQALLLPDARLDEMQRAARASAAPFDWDLTTEKYERVLQSACRKSVG